MTSTNVSAPNSSTCCTTALKNVPDTLLSAPYLLKILASRPKLFHTFTSFPATSGQASSPTVIIRPRYLKLKTVFIGFM